MPQTPESLALIGKNFNNRTTLLASGPDERGMVYGLLELADRITYAEDALLAMGRIDSVVESLANSLRSVTRLFVSDVEDKSWFYDKSFWDRYLSTRSEGHADSHFVSTSRQSQPGRSPGGAEVRVEGILASPGLRSVTALRRAYGR